MSRKKATKLTFQKRLRIIPTRPFDFDSTFYKPGHFPSNDTKWDHGKRWQTMFDVFHHWDYLKHISPWEQKIYTKIFFNKDYEKNLVPVDKMLKRFDKWGKWKNLAVHYVWEDIWWKRRNEHIAWLEKEIRL